MANINVGSYKTAELYNQILLIAENSFHSINDDQSWRSIHSKKQWAILETISLHQDHSPLRLTLHRLHINTSRSQLHVHARFVSAPARKVSRPPYFTRMKNVPPQADGDKARRVLLRDKKIDTPHENEKNAKLCGR